MSGKFNQAVKDIIPTYHENVPVKLLSHIESLYLLSLREKPNLGRAEIARFHVCTYLAVERFQNHFDLPEPETRRIPLPPKASAKLIDEFRDNLVIKSASNTPNSSPSKSQYSTPKSSPFKTRLNSPLKNLTTSPKISSPLKKLQNLQNSSDNDTKRRLPNLRDSPSKRFRINSSPTPRLQDSPPKRPRLYDVESPFNPKSKIVEPVMNFDNNNNYDNNNNNNNNKNNNKDDDDDEEDDDDDEKSLKCDDDKEKFTPKSSPTKYVYDRKHVTIIDLIHCINYFRIPNMFTPAIIQCFLQHKYKFKKKSEWLLACGLINSAYIRIHHKLLSSKIGLESEFIDLLFNYQRGGLTKWNLQLWCKIVEDWIKDENWILDIEQHYMYGTKSFYKQEDQQNHAKIGGDWSLLQTFGSMITGDVLMDTKCQDIYYDTWSKTALKQILENSIKKL